MADGAFNDVSAYANALRDSPLPTPNLEGLPPTVYEQDVVGLFDRAQNPWARKWTRCPFRCCWVCRGKDEQRWMEVLAQLVTFKEESGGCTAVPQRRSSKMNKKFRVEEAPDWWSKAQGLREHIGRKYHGAPLALRNVMEGARAGA